VPELTAELVALNVDVIVSLGAVGAQTAGKASTRGSLVRRSDRSDFRRVAASLERPGGNVTGIASFDPQQARKQFELLKRVSAFPLSAGHSGRCFAVMSSSPAMLIWSPKRSVFSAQRVHRAD
jgi:hypothetical protein